MWFRYCMLLFTPQSVPRLTFKLGFSNMNPYEEKSVEKTPNRFSQLPKAGKDPRLITNDVSAKNYWKCLIHEEASITIKNFFNYREGLWPSTNNKLQKKSSSMFLSLCFQSNTCLLLSIKTCGTRNTSPSHRVNGSSELTSKRQEQQMNRSTHH